MISLKKIFAHMAKNTKLGRVTLVKDFKKESHVGITTNHSGKMSGMASLSTSPYYNRICEMRAKIAGSICSKCYSRKMNKMYTSLDLMLIENSKVLYHEIISIEDLPFLNYAFFRLEAFGDLGSEIQVLNYFNLCEKNSHVNFALWTKNPLFIRKAMETYGIKKPSNLNIIYSSPFIDQSVNLKAFQAVFPFIGKVFTVYSKETVNAGKITINCGAEHCLSCLKCYTKNDIEYINEKQK